MYYDSNALNLAVAAAGFLVPCVDHKKHSQTIPSYRISGVAGYVADSYPVKQLEAARKELISQLYERPARNRTEVRVKRKCGILTEDVKQYYLKGIVPTIIDPMKFFLQSNEVNFDYESSTSSENVSNKKSLSSDVSTDEISSNSNSLSFLRHACQKSVCPVKRSFDSNLRAGKFLYVCDFCHFIGSSERIMLNHLSCESHFCASVYLGESTDNATHFRTVQSRCSLQLESATPLELLIACPKCLELFDLPIDCAVHSKLFHSLDYVYSTCKVVSSETVNISRSHDCTECCRHFSKLSDLVSHMKAEGHGPVQTSTTFSVLYCSQCPFQSNEIFPFKIHVLNHKVLFSGFPEMSPFEVKVLRKPTEYLHMPRFDTRFKDDIIQEQRILSKLLEGIKGHNRCAEKSRIIRCRKVVITSALKRLSA